MGVKDLGFLVLFSSTDRNWVCKICRKLDLILRGYGLEYQGKNNRIVLGSHSFARTKGR